MTDTNPPDLVAELERVQAVADYAKGRIDDALKVWEDDSLSMGDRLVRIRNALAPKEAAVALPGDAVPLVPQTEVDELRTQLAGKTGYIEMLRRQRDEAEAELARLREHAIQLPEDWRQQIDQVARANLGWYPQLVDAITALVESWRTATHPTPQGVMPIECDGGPYCEATKHYDFCQRRPAPETSEPREDWYPQIGDKVEAIADGEIMTVIPRQPMMAQADGFVHVESEHGQRWYLTPDTLRPVVVPTGEDTPDA